MKDVNIVDLYWKREERAVSETMDKYGGAFYSVTYGVLRSREDAEECVNDTYVKLWNSIPPAQPDDLGAFGCRVARNTALNRLKYESRGKRSHTQVVCDELAECIPSGENVEAIVDRMALAHVISKFLSSQTPVNRMMFMRRYFYMDEIGDIAKMLHVTVPAVKMALHRMRKKFRLYVEDEGFPE